MSLGEVRAAMRHMERIGIKDGDVVLVRVENPSDELVERLSRSMGEAIDQLSLNVFCWIVPSSVSLEHADDERLESLGLYRTDRPLKVNG